MVSCDKCKSKICESIKKPCKKVEKLMKDSGIFSSDWIRQRISSQKRSEGKGCWREVPMSSLAGFENTIDGNKEIDF